MFLPPRLLRIRYADVVHMLRELVRRGSLLGLAGTDHKSPHTAKNAHESNLSTCPCTAGQSIQHVTGHGGLGAPDSETSEDVEDERERISKI